ncbi:MAG: universal stress protein [Candidatus Helarchaeota archaeon]
MSKNQIFKIICIATDGSKESVTAAKLAIKIAEQNAAKVNVIYVIDDKVIDKVSSMSGETAEEIKNEYIQSGTSILQFIKSLATKKGIECETKLDEGYPSQKIIAYTNQIKADLLVIGHQYKEKSRILAIGSRTTRIIELSNCPLMIVK